MSTYRCPICDKGGLPNYKSQHTICPQCNVDLKPYLLLNSIAVFKPKNKNRVTLFLSVLTILSLLMLVVLLHNNELRKNDVTAANQTILALKDSLSKLTSMNTNDQEFKEPIIPEKNVTIAYKVKPGDCLSKVAVIFYDDWSMYKKIGLDNNITAPYHLGVGQTLIISLTPQ